MRAHLITRLLAGLAVTTTLVAPGLATTTRTAAAATVPLPTAVFAKTSDWGTGFEAGFTITNAMSAPLNTWTLRFALPANERVTGLWNGTLASGPDGYTVTNLSWNAPIAPGASVTVGFDASYTGTFANPTICTLNGNPCDGSADASAPTAPTGLAVLSTTATAVSLSWTGSTDNILVAGYNIFRGTTRAATVPGTTGTVTGLTPSTSYTFSVQAVDEAGNVSATSNPVSATTQAGGGTGHPPGSAAPFVDLGAFPTPNLTQIASNSGLRSFSLGFIVNGTQTCQATWFNAFTMSQGFAAADIASLRGIGGDVKPSFGGASGTELAQSCTGVPALTTQYQSVIDAYNLTQIDFDIEGAAVADPASVDRRSQAIAALQATARSRGRTLAVTLTLPVLPSGLTADGLAVVRSAINRGVTLTTVNLMAMDYGDVAAPNPAGRMGTFAIASATSVHDQLVPLLPGRTDTQLWNTIGVTPMLGQNDLASEVFTQNDMRQLLTFAQQRHLGELSFWDVTRDANACTGAVFRCTNIPQTPLEFSRIIAPFAG